MIQYSFVRTTAKVSSTGVVEFSSISDSVEHENIEIAMDWQEGERLYDDKEPYVKTGFIGKGFTKRGIYVSSQFLKMVSTKDLQAPTGKISWPRICINAANGRDNATNRS